MDSVDFREVKLEKPIPTSVFDPGPPSQIYGNLSHGQFLDLLTPTPNLATEDNDTSDLYPSWTKRGQTK
jgi:hypothetical protein